MAEDLKNVFVTDDTHDSITLDLEQWKRFCVKWSVYYKTFSTRMSNSRYIHYFTYIGYNYKIRNMIYSTNWVERLNRYYKRTTKMRASLPNPESVLLLLGSVAMTRKYYEYRITSLCYEKEKFRWEN